jgi:hypothetical protein
LTDDFLGISIIQVLELLWSGAMLLLDFVDTPISECPHNNKVANDQQDQEEIREHFESREVRSLIKIGTQRRQRREAGKNIKSWTDVPAYILTMPWLRSKAFSYQGQVTGYLLIFAFCDRLYDSRAAYNVCAPAVCIPEGCKIILGSGCIYLQPT